MKNMKCEMTNVKCEMSVASRKRVSCKHGMTEFEITSCGTN